MGQDINFPLTPEQIDGLHHTRCSSMFNKYPNRFDIFDASKTLEWPKEENWPDSPEQYLNDLMPDAECSMLWYTSRLEALFSFNYYSTLFPTLLLIDLYDPDALDSGWCICVKKPDWVDQRVGRHLDIP